MARDRDCGIQEGVLSKDYDELVFAVFGRRCVACGAVERIHLDHHQPHCDGHALLHNAVPLCARCNTLKGNKAPEVFYDRWKLVEVVVGLHEVRELFEARAGRSLKEVA